MLSEVLTQAEVDHERGTRASPSRPEQQPDDPRVDVGLLSAASEQEAASNRNGKMDGQTAEWGSVYDAAFFGFDFAPLIILGIAAVLHTSSCHALHDWHARQSVRDYQRLLLFPHATVSPLPLDRFSSTTSFLPGASTSRAFFSSRFTSLLSTITPSLSATD